MINTLFADEIVNPSELRSNQKHWLEQACSKPVTVNYGKKQLAIIDREQVSKLYKSIYYLELVVKTCEEYEKENKNTVLPWASYLSKENRSLFHNELLKIALKTLVTGDWDTIEIFLQDWKATAEVESNPRLAKALLAEEKPTEYIKIDE